MKTSILPALAASVLLAALPGKAEVAVTVDHNDSESASKTFHFKTVREPILGPGGSEVKYTLIDGQPAGDSGPPDALLDGQAPTDEDEPGKNFFFQSPDDGGRLVIDLGKAIPIKELDTYSWHPGPRAPQVYKLYGSDGSDGGFDAQPKRPQDPAQKGWKLVADVDTRQKFGHEGGQYGVSLTDARGLVGTYRYLLFDVSRTDKDDPASNTFFSEVNILDEGAEAPAAAAAAAASAKADASPGTGTGVSGKATVTISVNGKTETREIDLGSGNAFTLTLPPGDKKDDVLIPAPKIKPLRTERAVWLGILCEETDGGLVIHGIPADSPAGAAGLQKDDVVTKLDDQMLFNPAQLRALVRTKHEGDTVRVAYLRKGQPGTAEVKLAMHDVPVDDGKAELLDKQLQDQSESIRRSLKLQRDALKNDRSFSIRDHAIVVDKDGNTVKIFGDDKRDGDTSMDKVFDTLTDALRDQGLDDKTVDRIRKQAADTLKRAADRLSKPENADKAKAKIKELKEKIEKLRQKLSEPEDADGADDNDGRKADEKP